MKGKGRKRDRKRDIEKGQGKMTEKGWKRIEKGQKNGINDTGYGFY
jgi:hypothetical protein